MDLTHGVRAHSFFPRDVSNLTFIGVSRFLRRLWQSDCNSDIWCFESLSRFACSSVGSKEPLHKPEPWRVPVVVMTAVRAAMLRCSYYFVCWRGRTYRASEVRVETVQFQTLLWKMLACLALRSILDASRTLACDFAFVRPPGIDSSYLCTRLSWSMWVRRTCHTSLASV